MYKFIASILLLVSVARATVVTATVTDTDSQTWNNGTFAITLVNPRPDIQPSVNGVPLTPNQLQQKGWLSGGGVLNVTLVDNTTISPVGTQWGFSICPNASASCGSGNQAVAGTTQDLSSYIDSFIKAPRFGAFLGAYGYADIEITIVPNNGAMYYNVTGGPRFCSLLMGVCTWSGISGGGYNPANVAITGGSINGTLIGNITPSSGAFTTLSATSTVSGAGFTAYLASPPPIGSTTPNAITGTTITGTTITGNNTNGILNAATFSGGDIPTQLNNALASCNGTTFTVIQIPVTMGAGFWTNALPKNCYIYDYRGSGLTLYSATTANSPGGCGFTIFINVPAVPVTNPITSNCVGVYAEVNSDASLSDIWGINPDVVVQAGHVVSGIASEMDLTNNGIDVSNPFSGTKGKTTGIALTSGGLVPETAGFQLGANPNGSSWHHGLVMDATDTDTLSFRPGLFQFNLTQSVTHSASPQSVTITTSGLNPGMPFSIDAGANQENVNIISVSGASITAIFTKDHANSTGAAYYNGKWGFNFDHTLFSDSAFMLGNLQDIFNSGSGTSVLSTIKDTTGTEYPAERWDISNSHTIYSIGGGLAFKNKAGTTQVAINETNGKLIVTPTISATNGILITPLTDNNGWYDIVGSNAANTLPTWGIGQLGASFPLITNTGTGFAVNNQPGLTFTLTTTNCVIDFVGGIAVSHAGAGCP